MARVMAGLLMLYAFAVPWEYSLDLGEPLGNIARILGVLLLLTGILAVIWKRGVRKLQAVQWLVLALFLYFACSYFWTVDADATAEKMRAYFQVMMISLLVWEFASTPEELRGLVRAFLAGCWVLAILTFLDFTSSNAVAAEQIRFVAGGQDPNDVARFLDLGIPFGALLFATETAWPLRVLAIGYMPAALLAVLLTASRGGVSAAVAAVVGAGTLLVCWRPRAALAMIVGLATLAGALLTVVPSGSLERLATIPEQIGTSDLNDRFSIWVSGWHAFTQAPWLGFGAGSYATAAGLAAGDTAHNTLMAVLVTGGIVGFALFLTILAAVAVAVWGTTGLLRIALGTVLIVWGITSMVGSVEENRITWLLFGVMALAGRVAQEQPGELRVMFNGSNLNRIKPGRLWPDIPSKATIPTKTMPLERS